MRPTRILKSDVFRLATLFAFLFLTFTGVLILAVLWIVEGTQKAVLSGANDADIATISNGFRDEGLPEAIEVISQRLGSSNAYRPMHPDVYIVIENAGRQKLAGNLPPMAPRMGVFSIAVGAALVVGRGVQMGEGVYLFVGHDTTLLVATRQRILRAFVWAVLGASAIALAGGLFLGTRFMRRIDTIAQTCQSIVAGRLHERIPQLGRGDEWDRLAGAINEMLDRIAALLENLRQVSSDVAHDLRTPLTRMRNRLEQARTLSTSVAEYSSAVGTAIEDTDQLLAMFAALLRISQVEAGARQHAFSALSLSDILENIHQLYVPVAEDYRQSIEADLEAGIEVRGDAELLTQLFSNLVENAIRHTPERTLIRMHLGTDGERAAVSITDNGPGIDASEHEKIIRRFYRVSSSRSAAGHGLGLALVAAIAQLHQAKLAFSDAMPGLCVRLTFPLVRKAARGACLGLGLALLGAVASAWHPAAAEDLPRQLNLHGGKAIYQAACAACHGASGEGTPQSSAGFDPPASFPHFNKCDETTPEFTRDYKAVIRDGGPARGFSAIMPSFSGVLTSAQMDQVIVYLRSLCKEAGWPLGELNVPRALLTEKAFPESETILITTLNAQGPSGIANELVYERVLAKHDQLEVAVPFSWIHQSGGGLTGGLGDIAIGDKHIVYSHLNQDPLMPAYRATGSILSVQGEIVMATGDRKRGLGAGEPSLGIFGMYDRLFEGEAFMQVQAGMDLPRHTEYGPRSAYVRTAFGKSFAAEEGLGRLWSPMLEIIGNHDLTPGARTDWDVVPEFQMTINRRQHLRTALGYRVPLNDTAGRPKEVIAYFLWDWFDGGLLEGW